EVALADLAPGSVLAQEPVVAECLRVPLSRLLHDLGSLLLEPLEPAVANSQPGSYLEHGYRSFRVSVISRTKLVGASNGAACPAPSIRSARARGMASASDRTRRTMPSGLRDPKLQTTGASIVARSPADG